jgi:hypothetical protein
MISNVKHFYFTENISILRKVKGKVNNQGKYMLLCGNDSNI